MGQQPSQMSHNENYFVLNFLCWRHEKLSGNNETKQNLEVIKSQSSFKVNFLSFWDFTSCKILHKMNNEREISHSLFNLISRTLKRF